MGKLGMQKAAVASEGAAGGVDRRHGFLRQCLSNVLQLVDQSKMVESADRMDDCRLYLMMHGQFWQEIVMSPGHRVEKLELFVALRILQRQVRHNLARDPERAGASIAYDRNFSPVAPPPYFFDDQVRHVLVSVRIALRVPDGRAARSREIVRNPERLAGAR